MTPVPAAVLEGGRRERVRETPPRQELLVRERLRRTDSLLERLEALNLRGEARAPKGVEDIARGLLQPAGIAVRDCTVQELLDGVLDAQGPILSELRACRTERVLRPGA